MTTIEAMDTEQFICSVFSLPNKSYQRFNKLHKQLISIGQRFQVTVEKFHRLTQTDETGDLHHIRHTFKKMADTTEVQVAIFGKFHDEISSHNLVTVKDSKYLTPDCVPSRLRRNEWMTKSVQYSDAEGKPVAHVYMVYVHKNDNLQELALNIQKDIESFGLVSFNNLLLLVGMDPSIQTDASSIKSFETALTDVFHHEEKFHAFFTSSTFEDFISSEGEVPKMIQLHLEWKVIQPLQDMLKLIESNTHTYCKKSEETFKGPIAIKESLKDRFSETFLNNQGCLFDLLLGKFSNKHGKVDHSKIAEVIMENLAKVLQCLMVEVLAKIYGIKEYHIHEMLQGMVFKEECRVTIDDCIKKNLILSLPQICANYECENLQIEKERKKFCYLLSDYLNESFWDELKENADAVFPKIAFRVHEELEKMVMATDRNLAIQQKLKFEIESTLKQTVASNYTSHLLPPRCSLDTELHNELLRIECVEGVVVVCGELQVHVTPFSSVQKEKEVLKHIDDVIKKHKYWQNYRIGVIEQKPRPFYSVGSTLHCPALNRCGTLGGFVIDMDNNLYFLTCAHVVPSNTDVQVQIRGQHTGPITIGRSVSVQVPTETHISVDSVDIMAVRVKDDQKPRCFPLFKTADGEFGPSIMVQPFDCSLQELHDVYKWGANTNLTHGILHEGHYNKELFATCNLTNHQYIYVLVETPPVDDDNYGTFALPGDSGAIICAEAGDNYIRLISMIQGGDMCVRTGPVVDNYTIGFYLWCGLDKLLKSSGLDLVTVPTSDEEGKQIPQFFEEKHRKVQQFADTETIESTALIKHYVDKVRKLQKEVEQELELVKKRLATIEIKSENNDELSKQKESDVINQQSFDGHLYELSWNNFPRVSAFLKHLRNLYHRYERSISSYLDVMKEPPIDHLELKEQIDRLNAGPKILLLGEMFERTVKALVRNEKQLGNNYNDKCVSISNITELTEACTSFPTTVVFSAILENEDDFSKCVQKFDHDFDNIVHLFHHSQSKTILAIVYAIKVSPSIQENSEQLQHFRQNFNQRLKPTLLQNVTMIKPHHEECIVFWCNDELSKKISEHLELHIVSCLQSLEDKLKKNFHHRIQSSDPFNKTKFMEMIKEDLTSLISKDGRIISKLESEFKRNVETFSADTMKDILFDDQIHAVQMRIEKLSSSFGIQTKLIAEILSKINFQQQCKEHIQDSTVQMLMSILRDPEERGSFLKPFEIKESNGYISLFIKNISFAIDDAVQRIESIEEYLSIQERLHFETVSTLRRTIAKEEVDHLMPDIKVPAGIQFINGVKGFGIIYNKLHIHIQQLDEDHDREVRNEIRQSLQDYKYPYQIDVMVSDPKLLYSHYVGQKIVALCSRNGMKSIFGSVGAFMKDDGGDMYILTAHHVAGFADNPSNVLLVKDYDLNDDDYTRIGSKIHEPITDTLDIAAIKVINDHTESCDVQFKKPDGTTGPYDIFHGSPEDINGRNVYKRGASTGLTSGLIASANYTLVHNVEYPHFWIVPEDEPQGSNEFAIEGDSGASVCAVEEDDDGKVSVIGMVRAGKCKIRGNNGRDSGAVLAFSMHEGIRALNLGLRPYEY